MGGACYSPIFMVHSMKTFFLSQSELTHQSTVNSAQLTSPKFTPETILQLVVRQSNPRLVSKKWVLNPLDKYILTYDMLNT